MTRKERQTRGRGKKQVARLDSRYRPRIEALEMRLAPVVGHPYELPAILPGETHYVDGAELNFDGVVRILLPDGTRGTGSLMTDGLHILTAAHVAGGWNDVGVEFNLPSSAPGRVVPAIVIGVPASNQVTPPAVQEVGWTGDQGNDISLLRLTDAATDGVLVAPYYSEQIGYPLVPNGFDAFNYVHTLVGYGLTGTGGGGERAGTWDFKRMGVNAFDEATAELLNNQVQTIGLTGTPNNGSFVLSFTPAGGAALTTADIPWNADAEDVQDALEDLAPLDGNVIVGGGAPIARTFQFVTWFISFTGALAGTQVNEIQIASSQMDPLQGNNVNVHKQTLEWGGQTSFPASTLLYDFDNGSDVNDALGLLFGLPDVGIPPVEETQTVILGGNPQGANPTFRLRLTTPTPNPQTLTTADIAWNAPASGANSVQAALENLAGLNGNVEVTGNNGGPYTITFMNNLVGVDLNQLTASNVAAGGTVSIATTQDGQADTMFGKGDSGGPLFIDGQIAGVAAGGYRYLGQVPDFDMAYNGGFGELGVAMDVGSFVYDFIDPNMGGGIPFDLVLDMNKQALGVDGVNEAITITASRNGEDIEIVVAAPNSARYSGTYFRGKAADIERLTIRGSGDAETFVITSDLWNAAEKAAALRPIEIYGGGGADNFQFNVGGAGGLDDLAGPISFDGGDGDDQLTINDAASAVNNVYTLSTTGLTTARSTDFDVDYSSIEELVLTTGTVLDEIKLDGIESSMHLTLNANSGYDTVKMLAGAAYNPTLTSVQNLEITGGTITLNANLSIEDFSQSGGTLAGSGTLTITDTASWTGGTMSGSGTTALAYSSTTTLNGSAKALARKLNNSGDLAWSAGNITASDGAEINNQYGALFDIQGNVNLLDGGSSGQFKNLAGATLLKSAGAGTASLAIPIAANQGLIRVTSGTLAGPDTQVLQNVAVIEVDGGQLSALAGFAQYTGGILLIEENSSVNVTGDFEHYDGVTRSAGTITVTGEFQLDDGLVALEESALEAALGIFIEEDAYLVGSGTLDGDVTNGGHIKIGDTDEDNFGLYGELLITGNYTQESTGQLTFDLQDGLDYFFDVLTINGSASLDGTLYINVDSEGGGGENFQMNFSSFGPEEGEYHIIVCDDVTGIFDEEIGDGFTVDYLEDGVWVYLFLNQ